jgi:hypothetical protein
MEEDGTGMKISLRQDFLSMATLLTFEVRVFTWDYPVPCRRLSRFLASTQSMPIEPSRNISRHWQMPSGANISPPRNLGLKGTK